VAGVTVALFTAVYLKVEVLEVRVPRSWNGSWEAVSVQVLPPASRVWLAAMVVVALVIAPVPEEVVTAAPDPSPNVSLSKFQAVLPPKLPVPSRRNVPPVIFMVPLPVTFPPFTVMFPVPERVPEEAVRSPATVKLVFAVTEPAIERLLNVNTLLLTIEPPVMVIVPAVGARVLVAFTVSAPLTEKEDAGCELGVSEMVSPLNVRVPAFVIPHPVVDMVTVPPEAESEPLPPTESVPETEKLAEVVIEAEAEIARAEKLRVPAFTIEAVPCIVTLPPGA
jgi:hypothetical protein